MKYVVKFYTKIFQTTEVEVEAESEEALNAILDDECNEIWYKVAQQQQDIEAYLQGVLRVEEKSAHDERIRKEAIEHKRLISESLIKHWSKKDLP